MDIRDITKCDLKGSFIKYMNFECFQLCVVVVVDADRVMKFLELSLLETMHFYLEHVTLLKIEIQIILIQHYILESIMQEILHIYAWLWVHIKFVRHSATYCVV